MEKSAIIFEKNRDYIYHLQDDIYEVKILTKRDDIESVEFLYNDKYFNKDGHLLVPSTSLILLKKSKKIKKTLDYLFEIVYNINRGNYDY